MSPKPHRNRLVIFLLLIIAILLLVLGITCNRCHWRLCKYCPPPGTDTVHWASWNVLFQPNTADATIAQITNDVDDSLRKMLVDLGIDTIKIHPRFTHYFCPCDKTLVTVDLTLINESGNPVTPSQPPNPPQPPSYGLGGSVIQNHLNTSITIPEYANDTTYPAEPGTDSLLDLYANLGSTTNPIQSANSEILAILDTGLDSTEFKIRKPWLDVNLVSKISSLVWKDPLGQTLYNTLIGANPGQLTDDETSFKHGTSVAYIALLAAMRKSSLTSNTAPPPHIMVLKVLDSTGRGSVFTISCAMSYAIQHKATVINASLGYAGTSDPILEHYIAKADTNQIPVVVAAGNAGYTPHRPDSICSNTIDHSDSLSSTNLFYPSCYSQKYSNVITVTGVNTSLLPCYFQKFSQGYVSIGVELQSIARSSQSCCSFFIPYLNGGVFVEGSSFSAPVVSGRYLNSLWGAGSMTTSLTPTQWVQAQMHDNTNLKGYINGGYYITYAY